MADASPTVRRRRLGLILRGLRERAGYTGEEVGNMIDRSGSWVSRVEMGRVGLRSRDLNDLLELYRVDDKDLVDELVGLAREGKQRGWWSKYADTLSGPYATYIGFEAEASELLVFDTIVVPGLLQTEEYARAIIAGTSIPPIGSDTVERRVDVRRNRQGLLARTSPGPLRVWAILDESVLRRSMGDPDMLRAQLKHLVEASAMANITIQILPFANGPFPGMVGSFTVVRFPSPDDPEIVYIECAAGDIFEEGEEAIRYHQGFDYLRAAALGPVESRHWLQRALDDAA